MYNVLTLPVSHIIIKRFQSITEQQIMPEYNNYLTRSLNLHKSLSVLREGKGDFVPHGTEHDFVPHEMLSMILYHTEQ